MQVSLEITHVRNGRSSQDHLVQTCILQMWELRPRGGLTCPRSHSPSRAGLQLGLHVGSPGPSASRWLLRPPAWPDPRAPESLGGRAHIPGSLPAFDRLRAGPGPGCYGPPTWTAAPDPPTCRGPPGGSHTPCQGQEFGRPRRRLAPAAARGAGYAGRKAAGVTSSGR